MKARVHFVKFVLGNENLCTLKNNPRL